MVCVDRVVREPLQHDLWALRTSPEPTHWLFFLKKGEVLITGRACMAETRLRIEKEAFICGLEGGPEFDGANELSIGGRGGGCASVVRGLSRRRRDRQRRSGARTTGERCVTVGSTVVRKGG